MDSKLTLIILDVLESLDVSLSDSVMTETCSRQTTACSRQACSSCGKLACSSELITLHEIYPKSVNS